MRFISHLCTCEEFEYRPDLKGIKTFARSAISPSLGLFEYRPDLKGIKTNEPGDFQKARFI